jgi:aminoglycoside phosphotransferase (APT) family kinase protein
LKIAFSAVSESVLVSHLRDTFGLPISTVAVSPQGEDAYAYRAGTAAGEHYFVRVQRGTADERQETVYAALEQLQAECGLTPIVAPLRTTQGHFTSRLEEHTVSVFPFIDATTAYDVPLSDTHWRRLAAIMATLHYSGERCRIPELPRETFANPFATAITQALQRATSAFPPTSPQQQQVMALLREQRADLEATLQEIDRLGAQYRRLALTLVPTHGDPNLANVLLDGAESLHLIDWGELALGPRERDLMFFTGERFAAFLETYLERDGRMRLHPELFAFYLYRWALQEIADYTSRLLLEPSNAEAQAHAWQELQPYLPIPHAAIAIGVDAVRQTLVPFVRNGLVELGTV